MPPRKTRETEEAPEPKTDAKSESKAAEPKVAAPAAEAPPPAPTAPPPPPPPPPAAPAGATSAPADPAAPGAPRPDTNDKYERVKREEVYLSRLQEFSMADLLKFARQEGIKELMGLKKQEIIYKIIQEKAKQNGLLFGEGVLEVLPEGFGFLRSPKYNYLPCPTTSTSRPRRSGGSGCGRAT
jgi:transcription termination factor Rho